MATEYSVQSVCQPMGALKTQVPKAPAAQALWNNDNIVAANASAHGPGICSAAALGLASTAWQQKPQYACMTPLQQVASYVTGTLTGSLQAGSPPVPLIAQRFLCRGDDRHAV